MSTTLQNVPTPALVIDEAAARDNIRRLAEYGRKHNLGIRPHTKTHKSVQVARWQAEAGATGLTVAKVGEAEAMVAAHQDILLAYPALDPARTGRVAALAKRCTMRVAVDSAFAADALAHAAQQAASTIGILVDYDIGLHRTGLQTAQQTLELAQHVSRTPGLRLDGLFCYPGHISDTDPDAMIQKLKAVDQALHAVLDLWKRHGLKAGIVSGGSTPTAYQSHHVTAYTEIRPGTYVYNDVNETGGGWSTWDQCAARILCTVVSNAVPGKCIIDGGGKTLTYDRFFMTPNERTYGYIVEYPDARIVRLSEEHGEVQAGPSGRLPALGERVQVVMNHVCPCVNLHDRGWLKRSDQSLHELPTDARGMLS